MQILFKPWLAEVGREKFMGLVKDSLPTEVAIVKDQEFVFPDGSPSLAIRLRIQHIELLQYMRNLVLSNDLEIKINKALTKWQVRVDKTFFCKAFEDELVNLSDLTDHQKQKLADIKELMKHRDVHLSAPAGAGKTFVAAQCALDKLRSSPDGKSCSWRLPLPLASTSCGGSLKALQTAGSFTSCCGALC